MVVLARHANEKTLGCFPGLKKISKRTGLSVATVKRAIAALEDVGEIEVAVKRGKEHCNHYYLKGAHAFLLAESEKKRTEAAATTPSTNGTKLTESSVDETKRAHGETKRAHGETKRAHGETPHTNELGTNKNKNKVNEWGKGTLSNSLVDERKREGLLNKTESRVEKWGGKLSEGKNRGPRSALEPTRDDVIAYARAYKGDTATKTPGPISMGLAVRFYQHHADGGRPWPRNWTAKLESWWIGDYEENQASGGKSSVASGRNGYDPDPTRKDGTKLPSWQKSSFEWPTL